MKSICPTCKSPLYLPDNNQPLRQWSVLCSKCHASYQASPGRVLGAWLKFSQGRRNVYQARIKLQTGLIKSVTMRRLINVGIPIVLITPLQGLGKLRPILLIETQTNHSHLLIHPQQQIFKYQLFAVLGITLLVLGLGLSLQVMIGVVVITAIVSSAIAVMGMSRLYRGKEKNTQKRNRLFLEQRLIRQSERWGEKLQKAEAELLKLRQVNQRLLPYDKASVFRISSFSNKPKKRQYFERKYQCLNDLVERYILAKDLIDTSISIIQLTEEVPVDLIEQLSSFAQEIKDLEEQYHTTS